MKYIKRIDELYKSTYISAANKLGSEHLDRYEDLVKHADEMGIPDSKKQGRLYPHNFTLLNSETMRYGEHGQKLLKGKFTIYDEEVESNRVLVYLISDYGVDCILYYDFTNKKISILLEKNRVRINNQFKFDNRKDASEFRRFLVELGKDSEYAKYNLSEYLSYEKISLNKLYYTPEKPKEIIISQ